MPEELKMRLYVKTPYGHLEAREDGIYEVDASGTARCTLKGTPPDLEPLGLGRQMPWRKRHWFIRLFRPAKEIAPLRVYWHSEAEGRLFTTDLRGEGSEWPSGQWMLVDG